MQFIWKGACFYDDSPVALRSSLSDHQITENEG